MENKDNRIQFIDLAQQQDRIRGKIDKRIADVLGHGRYIMGPEVHELEKNLSEFVDVEHSISCASGTDALLMILMAIGVGPGDAVFTTPFTFMATAEVVSFLGATPVFVDIDPDSYNIDPGCLEKAVAAIKNKSPDGYPLPKNPESGRLIPKCIIPVDLFGLPAEYGEINRIAAENDLFVLEDAAQSFGARYKNRKAGNLAHAAATSFFPAKPLGCYGDGGAVLTNDAGLAEKIKSIRVHGKGTDKYDNVRIGINGRLDTIQAAILIEKLNIFSDEIEKRQKVAGLYNQRLGASFKLQKISGECTSVWAQYSVQHPGKAALMKHLNHHEIPTAVYYPKPLHCQPVFSCLGYSADDFPVSLALSENIFSLPMHPYLTDEEVNRICDILLEALPC